MATFSPAFLTALQSSMESIAKKREEINSHRSEDLGAPGFHYDDVEGRLNHLERSLVHVMTRLERVEESSSKRKAVSRSNNNDIEETLAGVQRTLLDAWTELLKQNTIILNLTKENENLREKLKGKAEVAPSPSIQSTSRTQFTPAPSPSLKSAPLPPQPPLSNKITSKKPPIQNKPKPFIPSQDNIKEDEYEQIEEYDSVPAVPSFPPPRQLHVDYPSGFNPSSGRRFSVVDPSLSRADYNNIPKNEVQKDEKTKRFIHDCIENNPLFKGYDDELLYKLVNEFVESKYEKNVEVVKEGDKVGDDFYVIQSGSLDVYKNEKKVATIEGGRSFGEIALMYNCPRTATVKVASSDCILWDLNRLKLKKTVFEHENAKRVKRETFLKGVDLLKPIKDEERRNIADALQTRAFNDGAVIIEQGTPGDEFYIVEKGQCDVTKGYPPVKVKTCREGDYFGELALLSDQPRAATVTATGKVELLYLSRDDFDKMTDSREKILKRKMEEYEKLESAVRSGNSPQTPSRQEMSVQKRNPQEIVREFVREEALYKAELQSFWQDKPYEKVKFELGAVTDEDIGPLMSNIQMMLSIYSTGDLGRQLTSDLKPANVGEVFTKLTPGLKYSYSQYYGSWEESRHKFEALLRKESTREDVKRIVRLFRSPLERVGRYVSFLEEMEANVPPNERAKISEVIDKIIEALPSDAKEDKKRRREQPPPFHM